MIIPLLTVCLIAWVLLQARASRAPIWNKRRQAFIDHPVRKQVAGDIRATWRYATTWRVRMRDRREMKKLEPPDYI